jgi:hypothetical protein
MTVIVIGLLITVLVSSSGLSTKLQEGFAVPRRSDVGLIADGWTEETGYERDLRYTETFTDLQGLGVAADFCRAVGRAGDPNTKHLACALGRREGMDTMEYRSRTVGQGFRFSRDDYWRRNPVSGRMDYCRILKDEATDEWYSACAVAGVDGFKAVEERDTDPPPAIRQLLEAYDGVLSWWRWWDDSEDYAGNTAVSLHGRPELPSLLKPEVSRGLQLNRGPSADTNDYLRWGETGSLALDQSVPPRQIRAISFWIWWDSFEKGARVLECSEGRNKNLMWIGVEGGEADLPAAGSTHMAPAKEVSPAAAFAIGSQAEPWRLQEKATASRDEARYVMEIWDEEQQIMRIAAHGARTGAWQHVVFTATDSTAWWPTWQLFLDGASTPSATRTNGRLSPALSLTQNFIGRGVRGCIQDFRVYSKPMTAAKIAAAIRWGRPRLHPSP